MKLLCFLLPFLLLSGCAAREWEESSQALPSNNGLTNSSSFVSQSSEPSSAVPEPPETPSGQPREPGGESGIHPFLKERLQKIVQELLEPGMSDYEKTKAAFDYMLDHMAREEPVGQELWRIHGDSTFAVTHVWGQRLIDRGLLTPEQNAEIAAHYLTEPCPQDYPVPPQSRTMQEDPPPDLAALQAQIDAETAAYEQANGPLPELELNTVPPVFGLEGYGPAD